MERGTSQATAYFLGVRGFVPEGRVLGAGFPPGFFVAGGDFAPADFAPEAEGTFDFGIGAAAGFFAGAFVNLAGFEVFAAAMGFAGVVRFADAGVFAAVLAFFA